MSVNAGRIVCPRCGANNFDTQAACWKCGAPLNGTAPSANPQMANPQPVGNFQNPPMSQPNQVAYPAPSNRPDPSIAVWSATFLGILIPYAAVPAGLVFMMFDDRRRIQIGRVALIWGLVGTFGQFVLTGCLMQSAVAQLKGLIPGVPGSKGLPNLGGDSPKLNLPGLGGDADTSKPVQFPKPNE